MFGTSPLKVRMEQIHERSNVAGHGVVEGSLEVVLFDHAPTLYQAVVAAVGFPQTVEVWLVGNGSVRSPSATCF